MAKQKIFSVRYNVMLQPALYKALTAFAAAQGVNASDIVRTAIDFYIRHKIAESRARNKQ